jgi:hypothetical protein
VIPDRRPCSARAKPHHPKPNEIAISTEPIAGTPDDARDMQGLQGEGSAIDAAERRELEALGIEVLESSPSVMVVLAGDAAFAAALARQAGVERECRSKR